MIKEKAYAKVNLFLNVLDKRKDGYHNLEMLNAKIDLCDTLEFKVLEQTDAVIIKSNDLFLSSQENIVIQVAKYMMKNYQIQKGLEITIDKKIPFGAGLAGNSSDSAAVIKGINRLFSLGLTSENMVEIGMMFGADIPYCLTDQPAFVSGIGEKIEPVKIDMKNYRLLLINPCEFISTNEVFKLGDKAGYDRKDIKEIKEYVNQNNIEALRENLFNSLEKIVIDNFEVIRKFRDFLIKHHDKKSLLMTGSGSSFIMIVPKNTDFSEFISKYGDKYLIKVCKFL